VDRAATSAVDYLIIGVRSRWGRISAIRIDGKPACGAICYYADIRARSFSPERLFIGEVIEETARARFRGVIRGRSRSRVVSEPLTLIIGQWYWFWDGTSRLLLPYRLFRSDMTIVMHSTSSFLAHLHTECPDEYRSQEL